jgi:periplasmic copper chaperone A
MKKLIVGLLPSIAMQLAPGIAHAHISIASGPGFANTTQEITFGVGHGCAGTDTYRVRIEIPTDVLSVRPLRSDFGKVSIEKDTAGTITAVSWQKADADALDADLAYYKLVVRLKVPNKPFTTYFFKAHQTCRAMDGTLSTVDWTMLPTDPAVDGGSDEPAPALVVLPARQSGWNKYVVAQPVADLSTIFSDAQIAWKGTAAYSANPNTAALITSTAGVTALTSLAANDEIWVKY